MEANFEDRGSTGFEWHPKTKWYVLAMKLDEMPRIDRLTLAVVTALPPQHPEHATFRPFPVHAWVIHHPEGPILFDTGIGFGNDWIDEHFAPKSTHLCDALSEIGLQTSDIATVVISHLHFDHCGQLGELSAPVYVQTAEYEASKEDGYTIPEWAEINEEQLRLVNGDVEILKGVWLFSTPGHTPGHQSILVEGGSSRILFGAQCASSAQEIRTLTPSVTNLHGDDWAISAAASLQRVKELAPTEVHLSHDIEIVSLSHENSLDDLTQRMHAWE